MFRTNSEQSSGTRIFNCLYHEFCVRVKGPGLAALEKEEAYEGIVQPELGGEADGTACQQPAQSVHRCGRHGNTYSMSYRHRPKKCLGEKRENKPWVTSEIMNLCDKRGELRHDKYTSLTLGKGKFTRKRTGR
ncbi:hypothetical protein DPMN_180141 [Dreissena polymorpha]|uniref:Uncharacterized protein n=1 Tax=Dreissena polymorpha TaxID=45954 RepID=A0A9D4IK73_DREPO|nr:hypothetical protein DPMN_180141 [Dreissena polymorpha]